MFIKIEIKDEDVTFDYDVGSSKGKCTTKLNAEILIRFSELGRLGSSIMDDKHNRIYTEAMAKAWIEKNIDETKTFIKEL